MQRTCKYVKFVSVVPVTTPPFYSACSFERRRLQVLLCVCSLLYREVLLGVNKLALTKSMVTIMYDSEKKPVL